MKNKNAVTILAFVVIKQVIAVLKFPTRMDEFIIYAKAIKDAMNNSTYFGGSAGKITTLGNDIKVLEETQVGTKTKPATHTISERDGAKVIVENDLRSLRSDVQAVADANPAKAEEIIKSADMKVKKEAARNKQDFVAENGEVSGTALLIAKGIGNGHAAHDWEMSTDGITWTHLIPTLAATTLVSGLVRATIVKFRHRAILKDGPTDWDQIVELVIK